MSTSDWRGRLLDEMPPDLAEEIDIFEGQMELRRQGKIEDRVFADLRSQYQKLKQDWGGYDGYDGYDEWFSRELNNAQLNTIANYYDFLPAFERVLEMNGNDMEKFYVEVERLSNMSKDERHQWLRNLASGAHQ